MRVLALDTATRRATVVAWEEGRVLGFAQSEDPLCHAERVFGLIEAAMQAASWERPSIELVACGVGPGSFTGARLAVATTKGIALALGRPICGIDCLSAMAHAYYEAAGAAAGFALSLIDAKKGEVFLSGHDKEGQIRVPPTHLRYGEARDAWERLRDAGENVVVLGEAAAVLDIPAQSCHRSAETDLPHAAAIASLAALQFAAQGATELDALEPVYLRPPDITLPAVQRSVGPRPPAE